MSSNPIDANCSATFWDGAGVILSITEIGNSTFSAIHSTTLWSMTPRFSHSAAIVSTEVRNMSPLWEKLSQDTTATGVAPAWKRRTSRAVTRPIAVDIRSDSGSRPRSLTTASW